MQHKKPMDKMIQENSVTALAISGKLKDATMNSRTCVKAADMALFSGNYINLSHPEGFSFDIKDLAHALANTCRFCGHVRAFCSVAQHSIHVSHIVSSELQLAALLHDASEAFLGDVTCPSKPTGTCKSALTG